MFDHLDLYIEPDEQGGFRAYFEDWITRAGHGDTPTEAIKEAAEYAQEWLDAPPCDAQDD